jgi:hypothetical protein
MGQYGYGKVIMLFIVSFNFLSMILNPGILTLLTKNGPSPNRK